jgi:hypothetical protein
LQILEINGGGTYPSSSSRSTGKRLKKVWILTEVLGVGVDFCFSLVVQEEVVHLDVEHHHVGGGQVLLSGLNHHNLLAEHVELTERHLRLHSFPVLLLASILVEKSLRFSTVLETLFESSAEVHLYF